MENLSELQSLSYLEKQVLGLLSEYNELIKNIDNSKISDIEDKHKEIMIKRREYKLASDIFLINKLKS